MEFLVADGFFKKVIDRCVELFHFETCDDAVAEVTSNFEIKMGGAKFPSMFEVLPAFQKVL